MLQGDPSSGQRGVDTERAKEPSTDFSTSTLILCERTVFGVCRIVSEDKR